MAKRAWRGVYRSMSRHWRSPVHLLKSKLNAVTLAKPARWPCVNMPAFNLFLIAGRFLGRSQHSTSRLATLFRSIWRFTLEEPSLPCLQSKPLTRWSTNLLCSEYITKQITKQTTFTKKAKQFPCFDPIHNLCFDSILHHQADFLTKSWGICIDTVMLEPSKFVWPSTWSSNTHNLCFNSIYTSSVLTQYTQARFTAWLLLLTGQPTRLTHKQNTFGNCSTAI